MTTYAKLKKVLCTCVNLPARICMFKYWVTTAKIKSIFSSFAPNYCTNEHRNKICTKYSFQNS